MDTLKLGHIIEGEQHRDAIHIAVAPVTAAERLSPGQHIGFIGDEAGATKDPVGIVDPFLKGAVFKGERFWMFLYPGSITSLRHEWAHPAFEGHADPENPKRRSEMWLRDVADDAGVSYGRLLQAAEDWLRDGEYLVGGSELEGVSTPEGFWDHYKIVTGTDAPSDKRQSFFTCSC